MSSDICLYCTAQGIVKSNTCLIDPANGGPLDVEV